MSELPDRLKLIIEDFALCEGREKIELLIEYAEKLAELPERLSNNHDSMDFVEECMTPVFVLAEKENDGLVFYFDVPPESPTVRGFAAILADGLNGNSPEKILSIPNDFYQEMGLDKVLSMQRLNGIRAILAHMKRLATETLAQ